MIDVYAHIVPPRHLARIERLLENWQSSERVKLYRSWLREDEVLGDLDARWRAARTLSRLPPGARARGLPHGGARRAVDRTRPRGQRRARGTGPQSPRPARRLRRRACAQRRRSEPRGARARGSRSRCPRLPAAHPRRGQADRRPLVRAAVREGRGAGRRDLAAPRAARSGRIAWSRRSPATASGGHSAVFYADTAFFGAAHALRSSFEFFGAEHVLFGTDMPLGGP